MNTFTKIKAKQFQIGKRQFKVINKTGRRIRPSLNTEVVEIKQLPTRLAYRGQTHAYH